MNKSIVIYGGGTVSYISNHFALCAPSYGQTARRMGELFAEHPDCNLDIQFRLTRMAGGELETNEDVAGDIRKVVADPLTKIVVLNAALCDFYAASVETDESRELIGKYATRLDSSKEYRVELRGAPKVRGLVRRERKDIFFVAFKTTCGAGEREMYLRGLALLKSASANLVLVNDTKTRLNMIVTPEEAVYHVTGDREEALRNLVDMTIKRSHLSFTRSTVVSGESIPWNSPEIPQNLREVVDYCIAQTAYKPFMGATVGHFAVKVNDTTFLTSKRKSNFNDLATTGLVKVVTDGPDTVYAYGSKPSVGGQSQRIIFREHEGYDCIVHFHCPLRKDAADAVPVRPQRDVECGSHECGANTSGGLKDFGQGIKAVYLDQHGPNIVFRKDTPASAVKEFIARNFDLSAKTDGYTVGATV